MKNKLVLALWCGLCVCASAAFQYEVVKNPVAGQWNDGGPGNGVYGYSYTIKVTEGTGSIYILDKIDNLYSMPGNNELLSLKADMTVGNYGYVDQAGNKFNADGSTITTYDHQMSPWNDVITQTGYKLGEFQAGDEIGVWLTDNNGKTGASILDKSYAVNSPEMNYRDAYVGTDALSNDLFQLDFKNSGSVHFSVYGTATPTGKPLPGVLATLLLGSGALGALGLKKKHATKS